jgi:5-methylcytosine-specific restriction endonuclease McrA
MAETIISRAEARAQGLIRYFTGRACKRGHIAERHVSNLTCVECQREKSAARYPLRDREKERERLAKWRDRNREKVNAKSRRANATPERKAYKAAWYQAHRTEIVARLTGDKLARRKEQNKASAKAWAKANPEKFASHMRIHASKRRAQKHQSGGKHTSADLAEILTAQGGCCAYCRISLKRAKKHVDHIVPLARGGSNGRENIQYLCAPCNQAKSAKDPIDFAQSRGLLL